MTKQTRLCLAVLALLGSFAGTVFAQAAGSGQITGTVRDPNGLVMPAARVVVRNIDTGIDKTLSTNEAGIYVATFLQPGHYEVTVTKAGFAKVLRKDLTLQVGQTLTHRFLMPSCRPRRKLSRSPAQAPVVDTEKTDVSQVVSTALVDNLPIAGRRWETFVLLTPNVTNDGGTGLVSYRGISGLYNQTRGRRRQQQPGVLLRSPRPHRRALRLQHGLDSGVPGQLQQLQRGTGPGRRRRRQRRHQVRHQHVAWRPVLLPALSRR